MGLLQLLAEKHPRLQTLSPTSLIKQSKGRQPNRQIFLANTLRQRIHLTPEPAPSLRRPAIQISAPVHIRTEELLGQIPIPSMDLDTIEANVHNSLRSGAVVPDCAPSYLVLRRLMRVKPLIRGMAFARRLQWRRLSRVQTVTVADRHIDQYYTSIRSEICMLWMGLPTHSSIHLSHVRIRIKEPRMVPESIKTSIKPGRPRPINKRPLEHIRLKVLQTPKRSVIPEETFTHLLRR